MMLPGAMVSSGPRLQLRAMFGSVVLEKTGSEVLQKTGSKLMTMISVIPKGHSDDAHGLLSQLKPCWCQRTMVLLETF